MQSLKDLKHLVQNYLNIQSKCYGHCDTVASLKFLKTRNRLVATFSCENGYVSRIIGYDNKEDVSWFKNYLRRKLGDRIQIDDKDIRVATRHPWDLGIENKFSEDFFIKEVYWTQNYRKLSVNPNALAVFQCLKCKNLFIQELSSRNSLCESCK
jgi:hypothetical protein